MRPLQPFLNQLSKRTSILISGAIAFFLVGELLNITVRSTELPGWSFPVANASFAQVLFVLFLAHGLFWIVISLVGLKALARSEDLQHKWKTHFLFQSPMLLQILVFVEHGMIASFYIFLTGEENKGAVLGLLLIVHVLAGVIFAPKLAQPVDELE